MTDWRALCKELADDLETWASVYLPAYSETLVARARAALAQPEPETAELPSNYIDPEHTGNDREMLEVFYTACQSEGGTADEIHLRGLRAVLARFGNYPVIPDSSAPVSISVSERLPGPEDCDGVMADLSPAAQAVLDAFVDAACGSTYEMHHGIAAALRAAADQVVPEHPMVVPGGRSYEAAWSVTVQDKIRDDLLAIAAELLEQRHPAPASLPAAGTQDTGFTCSIGPAVDLIKLEKAMGEFSRQPWNQPPNQPLDSQGTAC